MDEKPAIYLEPGTYALHNERPGEGNRLGSCGSIKRNFTLRFPISVRHRFDAGVHFRGLMRPDLIDDDQAREFGDDAPKFLLRSLQSAQGERA
jgi:hypothetical protein